MNVQELAAHTARCSGTKPVTRRNYTRELRALADKGQVVVASLLPFDGKPVTYKPRSKGDPKPWTQTDRHGCEWRYTGRECHTVPACGRLFLGDRKCALPVGHGLVCSSFAL